MLEKFCFLSLLLSLLLSKFRLQAKRASVSLAIYTGDSPDKIIGECYF